MRPETKHRSLVARFHARFTVESNGCWRWTSRLSTDGYGAIKSGSTYLGAHRVSWQLVKGEVPAGRELDHLCRNRWCVNPDHLEPVTHAENVLRGQAPAAINARKTHCKRGHEFTPENTYTWRTHRICRTCQRVRREERAS